MNILTILEVFRKNKKYRVEIENLLLFLWLLNQLRYLPYLPFRKSQMTFLSSPKSASVRRPHRGALDHSSLVIYGTNPRPGAPTHPGALTSIHAGHVESKLGTMLWRLAQLRKRLKENSNKINLENQNFQPKFLFHP